MWNCYTTIHLESFLDQLGLNFLTLGRKNSLLLLFINYYYYWLRMRYTNFDAKYNSPNISISRFHCCYAAIQHCLGKFVISAICLSRLFQLSHEVFPLSEGPLPPSHLLLVFRCIVSPNIVHIQHLCVFYTFVSLLLH